MSTTVPSFYVTGGTLRQDAPCYVERRADQELYEALCRGEYCYVLHARQMGKSSLMVHTAARLRGAGVAVAVLDLTAIGQHLTVEQWYDGLLRQIGRYLGLEDDLEEFWLDHGRRSPLQRWLAALQEVVLARCPGPNVLFLDEIDTVGSLPFSTDEFFAAIRECYNRRSQEPAFRRLTFCLVGVATPSDLIRDTRTTPFNIGRRIELTDFTAAEAAPLAVGLSVIRAFKRSGGTHRGGEDGQDESVSDPQENPVHPVKRAAEPQHPSANPERLLQRALYWTGGHPYLTQRLCQGVAEALARHPDPESDIRDSKATVDRVCQALFLAHRAQARDDNLLFVRDRLLRSEADVGDLLSLYARVRSPRQQVPDDETNPLVSRLRLSGVVREQGGYLRVRNRIYAHVFDRDWVNTNMPDAELRRLRALAREEARKRRLAEQREQALRRNLYVSDMNLAQQAWDIGNLVRALELLEAYRPRPGQEDLRGFEWRYLWRGCRQGDALFSWSGLGAAVSAVAWSPDGRMVATGDTRGIVQLWDPESKQPVARLSGHSARVAYVGFTPAGASLIATSVDGMIKQWEVSSRRETAALRGIALDETEVLQHAALSPTGTLLAMGGPDGAVSLYDLSKQRLTARLEGHTLSVWSVAFSPDGRTLATGSRDASTRLWEIDTGREVAAFKRFTGGIFSVAFSPDGRTLATGSWDGIVRLWGVASRRLIATLKWHRGLVRALAFSPDGRFLASVGETVRLWELAPLRLAHTLRGHTDRVDAVAFSPDSRTLITGSQDQSVKLWPVFPEAARGILHGHRDQVWCLAFSPDGRTLATGSYDTTVRLWDTEGEREIVTLHGHDQPVACLAFAPDGRLLASGTAAWNRVDRPGEVRVWDVCSQQELLRLPTQAASVQSLCFSPDGTLLATRNGINQVTLWEVGTWRAIAVLGDEDVNPDGWTSAACFSPDGRELASGQVSRDSITFWDVREQRPLVQHHGLPGGMSSAAFSADGRVVACGTGGGVIILWNCRTRREVAWLKETAGAVYTVAFSPNGRLLAAGYLDSVVRLWDLATMRQVAALGGHDNVVTGVAFSPDGSTLASSSGDGTVRLWRAASWDEADCPPHAK